MKILLVDDQPANLLVLQVILEDLGQELVEARSGEDALQLLAEDDFAVALVDVQMPGLDGFETARLIRSRQRSQHTPIIFLTAHDDKRFPVEQAYTLGAVDYLVKPLVPLILRAKVAGFVDLFRKAREIERQAERLLRMERLQFAETLAEENARLRESEARKLAILQTALDCIISMNHEGKVVEFNAAAEKLFGYPRADVLGKSMAELIIPPSLRERHHQGMARYLQTGVGPVIGKRIEIMPMRADGGEFPVELAITPIRDAVPPMFTAYLRDITQRQRTEERLQVHAEELREADRLKDEFLAMLAHELRNPLAPIRNALHVMKTPGADVAMIAEARAIADRQVQHMALLIAQEFHPQVVLLDIGMPGMDGYQVARQLRLHSNAERMILVALTGWGQDDDRQRSEQAGFDQHLVKPVEPNDLHQLLRDLDTAE